MRPIDADAMSALLFERMGKYETLANDLPKHSYEGCVYYGKVTALYETLLAIDRIIPTLDYAPVKHGEWLGCENYNDIAQCSSCGLIRNIYKQEGWNHCPNCGAKMDGGKSGA